MSRPQNNHTNHSTYSKGKIETELRQEPHWVSGPGLFLVGGPEDLPRHEDKVLRRDMFNAYFYEINEDTFESWNIRAKYLKYGKAFGPKKDKLIFYKNADALSHDLVKHPLMNVDFDSCMHLSNVWNADGFKLHKFFAANVPVISSTFTTRTGNMNDINEVRAKFGYEILDQYVMYEIFLQTMYPQYETTVTAYRGVGLSPMLMSMSVLRK